MVYLKSIDAYGFKSFAEHTHVDFDNGVTAIVGPNGSGKSNITDAIKWVLGEQSAKSLRGSKMEDVIFNGSKERKKCQYAEVKLTLDNHSRKLNIDEDTITVERRLYRNGDSEYYLNKERTRLKSVLDLFLDSGLGKEAFSIISQGKVDEVLNAKPSDRRYLIEEAAGVLKYKKRKKEATQKLDETEQNLNRVEDIVFDLEARVEPLREEAAIAEEYIALKEEMKKSDITVTVYDIESLNKDFKKLEQEIEHFQYQKEQKTNELDAMTFELNEKKKLRDQISNQIQNDNKALVEATESLERFTGQLEVLKERQKNSDATNERLEEEKQASQMRINKITEQIKEIDVELKEFKDRYQALVQEINGLEGQLSNQEGTFEEKIEQLKDRYYQLMTEQSDINNDIRFLEDKLATHQEKQSRLDGRQKEVYEELQRVWEDKSTYTEKLQSVEKELQETTEKYKSDHKLLKSKEQAYKDTESKLYQAYRYTEQMKTRINTLKSMQDEYSGFYSGVKHVLKEKSLNGIEGAVAEIIDTPSKLTTAIEIALGASLQHIIVQEEKDARLAIKYLKDKKLGRATFLPMNVVKKRFIPQSVIEQINDQQGFITVASEGVKYDEKYRNIVEHLLGSTIIAKDLETANQLARLIQFKHRIVTLEGDVITPGGAMTGGGKEKKVSLLSQKDELKTTEDKYQNFMQQTTQIEENVKALKQEVQNIEQSLTETQEKGTELRAKEHEVTLQLDAVLAKEKRLKDENETFEFEKNDGYNFVKGQETLQEKQNKLVTIKQDIEKIDNEINQLNASLSHSKDSEKTIQNTLNEKRSNLAVEKERNRLKEQDKKRLKEDLNEYEHTLTKINDQIELINSDDYMGSGQFEKVESQIQLFTAKKQEIETKMMDNQDKYKSIQEEIEQIERDTQSMHQSISGLETGLQDMVSKHSKIDIMIEHQLTHLNETYQLTFEKAQSLYEMPEDISEARKTVKLTKMSIDELGHVNLNAIEQFKEVNERYTFLSDQRTDLLEAKETLEQVILEMDGEVSTRFKETFDEVNHHFGNVFKSLFNGGRAELQLTDKDILDAGVEIVVQPPGKNRQYLSLLSGGERALSAISLLFAILKARTAPFVILDEVEAALDEQNVIRYAEYLDQLKSETQFIVITHRKGTMSYADSLYGVTMQEAGISKLVSVNLKSIKEEELEALQS
ncbi:chromosome segregation protein SMC [Mammaliicoccus sciuri]|uniref:chromosome segregation protein SMC n=1 Tax=Mammaliicoccus sciuri TaxID=1296 RepID=UPI000BBE75F1|nr:chromosome segregation protein SMC [Mammaliicoccus sciuri]MDT0702079.1 chromosome segregation protein SMC [Mammaliicoccus sciuri]MDT0707470.1 chromosome segregation protein SMC [Mammaliicoccus sciuri]MDT0754904.1 chromosome segregation protein SMC [Mammaliicoccus sciuri]PCM42438.1 chromosome segregation protein SMC [Mammaliicoccus sciuri]UXU77030.1 chromosome segregation protein SMC [Mammaliicoccus sciuri]